MPVPKSSALRAYYIPVPTSRNRHRLPPPEEGEVVYPSPIRLAGSKHQPWQANQLAHDGILTISTQGAPDAQRNRWRSLIRKMPVRFRRLIRPAKNLKTTWKTPSTGFRNGRFCEIPPILSVPGTKFGPLRVPLILRNPLNVNILR